MSTDDFEREARAKGNDMCIRVSQCNAPPLDNGAGQGLVYWCPGMKCPDYTRMNRAQRRCAADVCGQGETV